MCTKVTGRKMKHTDNVDFENWLRRHTKNLPEPEVSSEFLATQRRGIYQRLGESNHPWISMRWVLSLAMLLLMVAGGLTLERRHNTATANSPGLSDDQLFSELSAMEQSNEPKAIQPMHGLFQE
jgi:hypothetical protein